MQCQFPSEVRKSLSSHVGIKITMVPVISSNKWLTGLQKSAESEMSLNCSALDREEMDVLAA